MSRWPSLPASDDEALELMRHDAAHVMAQAVQELWPDTQVTIGPAIEDGFYYDFARATPFTPGRPGADRGAHARDRQARSADSARGVGPRRRPSRCFGEIGETYKVEIIDDIIPEGEEVSVYRQGDWFDVCRGPHLPSTGKLGKGFKLMKLAGAYWRGNSANEMLQRIYGTAWRDKKELDAYLQRLEEAEKRDHRKLGKVMDLFHTQEEAPGMVFWHAAGWQVYLVIEDYIRGQLRRHGYQEVHTPQMHRPLAVGEVRALGEIPGRHVHHRVGKSHLCDQADELPGAHPDLQPGPEELPRPAAAAGRVRLLHPQRAVRHPARADAGAQLRAG